MSKPRAATLAVIVAAIAMLATAAPAHASQASAADVRRLARDAASDSGALRRLRDIDTVDGQPVNLRAALADPRPAVVRERLAVLAGDTGPSDLVSGDARRDAAKILAGRRFHAARQPRPFEGILRRLGGWLAPVGRPIAKAWARIISNTPGRVLFGLAVIGAAGLVAVMVGRRRSRSGVVREGGHQAWSRQLDPHAIDRAADDAERAGDLAEAVRLRFQAGLVRLDRAGALTMRPSLTTGEVRRRVPSPVLARLANDFDEIWYGGRGAGPDDVTAAREGWPRVLVEARSS
jgi:hypothetical protein